MLQAAAEPKTAFHVNEMVLRNSASPANEADWQGTCMSENSGHKINVNGTTFNIYGEGWKMALLFLRTSGGRT